MSGRTGYVPAINIPPGDFLQNPGGLNNNTPLVWNTGTGNVGDGGAIVETKAHSSATYAPQSALGYKTRTAVYSFGGGGGASNVTGASLSNLMGRMPLRLPVSPLQFRIHVANRDRKDNAAATSGSYTFTDFYIGPAALDSTGTLTGAFASAPTKVLSGFTTDLGTDYVSAWIDTSTVTLAAQTDYLFSYAYSCTSAQVTQRSTGRMFFTNGSSPTGVIDQVAVLSPTLTNNDSPQLEWWIEYQFAGVNPCRLYLGDSLTDGYKAFGGPRDSYPGRVSARTGAVSMVNAYTGMTAALFAGATTDNRWTKYTGVNVDAVHIALGTNDIFAGTSLATIQGYLSTIVANVRALYGSGIPIYLATVPPRSLSSANESVRAAFNTWVRAQPFGIAGVTDLDRALRDDPARLVTDGSTTSGSPTVGSTAALFTPNDVGRPISGSGIPASSYIGVWNSATSVGLSSSPIANTAVNATATATGVSLTIGGGPAALRPEYNSGDNTHPNAAGADQEAAQVALRPIAA